MVAFSQRALKVLVFLRPLKFSVSKDPPSELPVQRFLNGKGVPPLSARTDRADCNIHVEGSLERVVGNYNEGKGTAHLRLKYLFLSLEAAAHTESGMGPSTCCIMARCSRFSCVWNRALPANADTIIR